MSKEEVAEEQARWKSHMQWSTRQGRILTAEGKAPFFYTDDRGFGFSETELPHYHLLREDDTRAVFRHWQKLQGNAEQDAVQRAVVGAWQRVLFYGGWDRTTHRDEKVYNLQSPTLFIDLRLPATRLRRVDRPHVTGLADLTGEDLRRYARQHIFGGYTRTEDRSVKDDKNDKRPTCYPLVCTRHHIMDWNFVGAARNRPNKWWVETAPAGEGNPGAWKEWAYATDNHGQHYYCEQWESILSAQTIQGQERVPILVLRKQSGRDGLLVMVGEHFNFLVDRQVNNQPALAASLVATVDKAVVDGDLEKARAWLGIQGGHGLVTDQGGWKVDAAIEFWIEGSQLWQTKGDIQVVQVEGSVETPWKDKVYVRWKGDKWEVFECNLESAIELQDLLWKGM
jgi:hypothetical protein